MLMALWLFCKSLQECRSATVWSIAADLLKTTRPPLLCDQRTPSSVDPELQAPTKDYTSQLPLWLLKCNKCIKLVQDAERGGGLRKGEGRRHMETLNRLFNSPVDLKTWNSLPSSCWLFCFSIILGNLDFKKKITFSFWAFIFIKKNSKNVYF